MMGTEEKVITKEEEEEGEEDEGPPPGFQCFASQTEENIVKQEKDADINQNNINENNEDDEDTDGPPPGWSSIPPATHQPIHPSDVVMSDKIEEVEDEEGPPPGWHSVPLAPQLAEAVPADTEMESYEDRTKGADEGFQPAKKSVPPPKLLPPTPPPPPPAVSTPLGASEIFTGKAVLVDTGKLSCFERCRLVYVSGFTSRTCDLNAEKGQMVCGSCRLLLSYPRGVKYVQCSCCETVNLVLEDHQVGQVKCGGCAVLLMYPYGAPSVRCCSCRFVTDIGAQNRRPLLSVQQAQARRPSFVNRVH